jgi:hypothetical protein
MPTSHEEKEEQNHRLNLGNKSFENVADEMFVVTRTTESAHINKLRVYVR